MCERDRHAKHSHEPCTPIHYDAQRSKPPAHARLLVQMAALTRAAAWAVRLGGKALRSEVFRPQTCAFGDSHKHFRSDFFAVMKGEDNVRPAGARESLV